MIVDVAPHEREAMYQLVLVVRAIVIVSGMRDEQKAQTLNWAQMVEDVVDRLDGAA